MTSVSLKSDTQAAINAAVAAVGNNVALNVAAYNDIARDAQGTALNQGTINWFAGAGGVNGQQVTATGQGTFIYAYTRAAIVSEAAAAGKTVAPPTDLQMQTASNRIALTTFQNLRNDNFVVSDLVVQDMKLERRQKIKEHQMRTPLLLNGVLLFLVLAIDSSDTAAYASEGGYNATSLCLFASLLEIFQLPRIDAQSLGSDIHFSKLVRGKDETETGSEVAEYSYKSDGVSALILENSEHAFFKEWTISASILPVGLHSREYLVQALQIQNPLAQAREMKMSCDSEIVTLNFNEYSLQEVHVSSIVD